MTYKTSEIVLPFERPPMTANDQRRLKWPVVAAFKRDVSHVVYMFAKQIPDVAHGPSIVSIKWFAPDGRRRDVDCLGPFAKAVLDGLVKAGVWPDDHSGWVRELRLAIGSDHRKPRITIRIEECVV